MIVVNPEDVKQKLLKDRPIRRAAARRGHKIFMDLYLGDLIEYEMAPMHEELFDITQDANLRLAVVMAFRGSGKSTILSTSYPIWSIIGLQHKKFVVLVAQTQAQARRMLSNISDELEFNQPLRRELGPFKVYGDDWSGSTIEISRYDARILVASVEQSVRGIRSGSHRPDLVILDDVEDMQAVRTHESRQKTHDWFSGEILPLGDLATKYIVIGNKLHEDSLVMRTAWRIRESDVPLGTVKEFPILDVHGKPTWPGKYPTLEAIEAEESFIGDYYTWQREYLLNVVATEDQIIKPEHIHYYDPATQHDLEYRYTITSVDLAASQSDAADKTAMVTAKICGQGNTLKIYIVPPLINRRITFPQIIEQLQVLQAGHGGKVVVETVGTQQYVVQQLEEYGLTAEGFKPQADKRTRLFSVSQMIASGRVLFPKNMSKELEVQLIGFGSERYKDLVDALTMLILHVQQEPEPNYVRFYRTNLWNRRRGEPLQFFKDSRIES